MEENELDNIDFSYQQNQLAIKKYWVERKRKIPKYISAVPNGEDQNGSEKFIRQKQKKKISYNIMWSIIIALN